MTVPKAAKVCITCGGVPLGTASRCFQCIIRSAEEKMGYVPEAQGPTKRLSGATAQCILHRTRGCTTCFGEIIPARRLEELARVVVEGGEE